jgi:hypothetical protein
LEEIILDLKSRLREILDTPGFSEFHLFYRGPVAEAMVVGALVGPKKTVHVYSYDERGRYDHSYVIDRKFLKR